VKFLLFSLPAQMIPSFFLVPRFSLIPKSSFPPFKNLPPPNSVGSLPPFLPQILGGSRDPPSQIWDFVTRQFSFLSSFELPSPAIAPLWAVGGGAYVVMLPPFFRVKDSLVILAQLPIITSLNLKNWLVCFLYSLVIPPL